MIEGVPSKTAQRVAVRRAAHQLFDHPRVFEDPLAVTVIGEEAAAKLGSAQEKFETTAARRLRAYMAARSRFAEDELERAIARGATQYVILGAGLDTFGYRNHHAGLRVFEVDHPATQSWKQKRLDAAGVTPPPSLTFVPANLEDQPGQEMSGNELAGPQPLRASLEAAGFRSDRISFFSWLGVTPYLTAGATMATLEFIGSLPQSSGVVFDYAVERSALDSAEQLALDALASRVARAGEPFRLFLDSRALMQMLKVAGFHAVEDMGPAEIDSRYFAARSDGLQVEAGLAHLVSARV
jgi:methyltransferase (TIGR00027 family)